MASRNYPKLLELQNAGTLNWSSDTIRVMLVNASAAYSRTHAFVSDVVANELTGATRQTLASKTSADNGTDKWIYSAANPVFPTVTTGQTLGAAIVYKFITNDAASPLLAFIDGTDISTNGSDITVTIPGTGIFYFSY